MSSEGVALLIVTILLTVSVALFLTKILILSKQNTDLKGSVDRLTRQNNDLSWDVSRLRRQVRELTSKINANVKVGAIFYTPNNEEYKEAFRGTKQRITSIDYRNNTFKSINADNVDSVVEWTNMFNQITDFTWEKGCELKHKFV